VFVNSIASVLRLGGLLDVLECNPMRMHSKMQQRQRLKNLDRFTANENSLMIASDVLARGMDIKNVKHVVHYHVPRSVEGFIHRSGRSARSGEQGLSLMFVGPDESKLYTKICMGTNKLNGLDYYQIQQNLMREVKMRVKKAVELDKLLHKTKKVRTNNDWMVKNAKLAGIDLDEDQLMSAPSGGSDDKQLKMMKAELEAMLKRPIFPKGTSRNYITMSGNLQQPLFL